MLKYAVVRRIPRTHEALRFIDHWAVCAVARSRKEVEVLGHQLLRSGTSVAAHTREASRARSDAEFCSKIDGALQEADESQLWIELLREDCGISGEKVDVLHSETNELIAILVTMARRTRRSAK